MRSLSMSVKLNVCISLQVVNAILKARIMKMRASLVMLSPLVFLLHHVSASQQTDLLLHGEH